MTCIVLKEVAKAHNHVYGVTKVLFHVHLWIRKWCSEGMWGGMSKGTMPLSGMIPKIYLLSGMG